MPNVKWMKGKENELKIGGGLKSRQGGEGFLWGGVWVWGRAEKKIKATKCTVNLNRLNIRCAQQQKQSQQVRVALSHCILRILENNYAHL